MNSNSKGWVVFNWVWEHVLPWIIIIITGLMMFGIFTAVAFVAKKIFAS